MRTAVILSACLALAPASAAASFDNEAGVYSLAALPHPEDEAARMDRMALSDLQPAGRHVRAGESISVSVDGLPAGHEVHAVIGFLPMWNVSQTQQVVPIDGEARFEAEQDGPLFFTVTAPSARGDAGAEVTVRLRGGRPLPLYVDGSMDADAWAEELEAHSSAPFVQLVGERALITLPRGVHARAPIDDPEETFSVIDQVLGWQDAVAGFDGSTRRDRPTPLRMHYLVDFRVSAADRETFYMYATDGFIGMLDDNTSDLTDPEKLRSEWAIWHETGHTHQQHSWTFEALGEVNVNLFSLYVQERFGLPTMLAQSEDGEPTFLERARDYLDDDPPDYLDDDDENEHSVFIKLVMFHQLKEAYGWELFQDLHKHFRAHPLADDASDQDKADAFIEAICALTGTDLRPFFDLWALQASDDAMARIDEADYPVPEDDPSSIFE